MARIPSSAFLTSFCSTAIHVLVAFMHIFYDDDRLAILVRSPGSGGIALLHGLLCMLHPQMTWQRALIFSCVIFLVLAAVQIIMFSDLECDYINPIDLCNKLNQVRDSLDLGGPRKADTPCSLFCQKAQFMRSSLSFSYFPDNGRPL